MVLKAPGSFNPRLTTMRAEPELASLIRALAAAPSDLDQIEQMLTSGASLATPEGIEARPLLLVVEDPDGVEGLSFRNLEDVYVLASVETEVVDIMAARSILVQRSVWEHWAGGELTVADTPATAKAAPERTAPPEPKKITRKSADKPKRGRKKADDDDASSSVSLPPVEDDVEGDVETDPATAYDAPAADDAEIAVEGEEQAAAAAAAEAPAEETEDVADAETDEEEQA